MATIKFYLRTRSDILATVFLRFIDGRKTDIRTPTPLKMIPSYWDEGRQKLRRAALKSEVFSEADALKVTKSLNDLRDFILKENLEFAQEPDKDWIDRTVYKFFHKEVKKQETLYKYISRFVSEAEAGKRLATTSNTKKHYSVSSIRTFKNFKTAFELYCEEKKKKFNWMDINIDFYNDFIKHFYKRNCGANYTGKLIKILKTIMRIAREEEIHNNVNIELKAFRVLKEAVDNIYLTEDEIKRLFSLKLDNRKHLDVIRDVFLCGVYTAQRYSDYSRITKSNIRTIDEIKYIEINQQKTGEKCIVPLRPELDAILKKYDYTLPRTHEQKVNTHIKDIAREAGITEAVMIEKNRGGMIIKTTVEKCELVKTHTARRSACTNMYLASIPIIDIMKLSGHRTEKEFMKYICVTKQETAIKLQAHPYFSGIRAV